MVHAKAMHTVSPGSLLTNTTWVSLFGSHTQYFPTCIHHLCSLPHVQWVPSLYWSAASVCTFIHSFIHLLHHVTNRMLVLVWFPYRQLNLCPQQWKCGVQTIRPPGSTLNVCFCMNGIHSALNLTSIAIEPMWTNENY